MESKVFEEFWGTKEEPSITRQALIALIKELVPTIDDSYRADEEDTVPSMLLTISINKDCSTWSYQNGDNS